MGGFARYGVGRHSPPRVYAYVHYPPPQTDEQAVEV